MEIAVGVQVTRGGAEAFLLSPSSQIWNTEVLKEYEEGKLRSYVNGKPVALQDDKNYQRLKRTTPRDYRKIGVTRRARPIPKTSLIESRLSGARGSWMFGTPVGWTRATMAKRITFRRGFREGGS